ncbi:MAG TPA: AAA family ATPase [Terriglobales bacterium]|jgi:class 3 adenylate cyclase/tetratricopeptide (TPR) repeat protein|nr:AAA family ATPase [Terriglobales bacterium]
MTTPAPASVNATLATYLPRLQIELLQEDAWAGDQAHVRTFSGAVLVVDISGFTELTARFEQRGKMGAEQLSGILRDYFGRLTDIITGHGGDIVSFAGDAALAVWPEMKAAGTRALTSRCVQAALAIERENAAQSPQHGVLLKQRSAIATGQLHAALLGGSQDRLFLLAGEPLREAGLTLHDAAAGNVGLAPSALSVLGNEVTGSVMPSGTFVVHAAGAERLEQGTPVFLADPNLSLANYLPAFVADRVVAGLGDWLAEFRSVTVMFVGFSGFDASREEALLQLDPALQRIHQVLQRYEGSIYQFLMDDKGLALIGAFGLPPRAHEEDALRGVYAAVEIEAALKSLGIRASIGVATGSSFCGIYGSQTRRQYTALGRPMNIAARLMQAADGGILCDLSTTSRAEKHRKFTFQQLDPLQVKGSSAPLTVYRPSPSYSEALWTAASARVRQPLQSGIVGRNRERQALAIALDHLQAEKTSSLILLEGEAGIGKSRLIEELLLAAHNRQLTCLTGTGQAIEKAIPYHAWRPILASVFGLTNESESAERRRQRVLSQLSPDFQPLSSLLNAALPFDFPETLETRELQGEARADATRRLLLDVLKQYLASDPAVLILDDAHWFDSASWGLARLAAEELRPAVIVVAMRPVTDAPIRDYEDLLGMPGSVHLALEPLPSEDVLQLVCQRLGVKTMLQPIAQYVLQQTQGNPLFIEELVYALRDSGAIEIRDSECRLGPQLADSSKSIDELFRQLHMPETVPGIITSRIDRLSPSHQMLVKVASVIGRSFSLPTLHAVHPAEGEKARLPQLLAELESHRIVLPIAAEEYEFRHPLIQEVVYGSIPVALRRQLHQATAECYEHTHERNVESYAPLLAQHWTAAAVAPKAVHYSALAGEQALRNFAILEAVRFLTSAITLDSEARNRTEGTTTDDARTRAHWELLLGSAYVSWSKYEEAREHLEHGLALAGHPMPGSMVKGVLALLAEAARQVRIRMSTPGRAMKEDERRTQLELTRAYEGLMEIYYLTDKPVPCLYSVFRGLNLAEPAGASPELARCYSSTAALLGFMSFAKWADAYFARALTTGEEAGDSSAQAWVFMAKGVYLAGLGQRATAGENLQRSIEIYDRLGDARHGDDARANLAATCYLHGEFAESQELANRIYRSALVRRDTRVQAECARWRAYNLIALGRFSEVQSAIDELDALRSSTVKLGGYHRKQDVATLTALLRLNAGDQTQALEKAKLALELTRSVSDAFEFLLEHAALADVCLTVCESRPDDKGASEAARNAVKSLSKYARMFPVGRPAQLLYSGRLMSLQGKKDKAHAAWQRCLQSAESLSMPLYQGLAHFETARQLPAADAARLEHLTEARQLFERVGASHRANAITAIATSVVPLA